MPSMKRLPARSFAALLIIRAVCLFGIAGAAAAEASAAETSLPDGITFWSDYPADVLADALIARMSDEELLAQILMFGWAGQEPSALLNTWVSERGLGSVKIFGWNTDDTMQVADSVTALQRLAMSRRFQIPLYVATDQEGGWIRHVKGDTCETPGNLAVGASGYPSDAWYTGYYISRELRALGINMNFAPTVDVFTNLDSSVIGPRSFGSDPEYCGILGASFSAGSLEAGVLTTAKHYPGHGDTSLDSHGRLPEIHIDFDTLMNRELVPFKYLIAEKIPAIMTGHLGFPEILPNGEPASLSRYFVTDILRNELGFEGLIITDDMMMNGATLYAGSLSAAVRMAIEAGNDIIISSTTAQLNEALWRSNLELMRSSEEFKAHVVRAARHVLYSKLIYFKGENPVPLYPDKSRIPELVPDREGEQFFFEQACRSITVLEDRGLPYRPAPGERILLVGQFEQFFSEGRARYPDSNFFSFDYQMGPIQTDWMGNRLSSFVADYDTVIFSVADAQSAQVAERIKDLGKRVIIISSLSPVPAFDLTWADAVICTYSYAPVSYQAAFSVLAGEFRAQGTLPVRTDE